MWPLPLTPGSDWVRAIGGGARLTADRDLVCEWERGEGARGRKGREATVAQVGEVGDDAGEGSVERRRLGGFRG